MKNLYRYFMSAVFIVTLLTIFVYLIFRIYFVLTTHFRWYELFFAISLLFAEGFLIIHSIGYFLNVTMVYKKFAGFTYALEKPILKSYPPIAIVVASYKEPLDVLRDTLVCFYNLNYPNKNLYFLDDTRYDLPWDTEENKLKYKKDIEQLCQTYDVNLFRAPWHGAKAGMLNDFLLFSSGKKRKEFELQTYSKAKFLGKEKYLIVFDADMNPFPDFIESLIDIMEKQPDVAFAQTPQYYSNFQFNRVAKAAGLQQAIFYEYICEGKDLHGAMFCCGTNVIYRREALEDVAGFDETSVTEDFATSLKIHRNGWRSVYLNKVSAFGMGPEDLGGYFKQQFRWARGTLGIFRELPKEFLFNFRKYTLGQWWEYLLSSTHYFIGFAYFCMIIFPILFLFFDLPSYFADPLTYAAVFIPYIFLTLWMFIYTLKQREYKAGDIFIVLLLNAISFPVFIQAACAALLGTKSSFGITPKGGSHSLGLKSFIPQITMALLCIAASVWGLARIYFEQENIYGLGINVFWSLYNFAMISSFLYFNHSPDEALV